MPVSVYADRTMLVTDLIRKKRDGGELARPEIEFLVDGYTHDRIPDYQMSAWLMAVVLLGMSRAELAALTESMLNSGKVMDFSSLPAPKVDKHSTGGVGDKTSLVLAPLVAAAGVYVPMISGRGLGHTGGTLDKLESIPGFNVNLSTSEFRRVLGECGTSMIGQTPEIAPADKKLYALRDVTGTVESPYLICASIMSKKLSALITDMSQHLGHAVGNALEVAECLEILDGKGPQDLRELCLVLAAWMLRLGQRVKTVEEGRALAEQLIASGAAKEKFGQLIKLHGGNEKVIDDASILPRAKQHVDLASADSGYVSAIMCEQIGIAGVLLGGGRA